MPSLLEGNGRGVRPPSVAEPNRWPISGWLMTESKRRCIQVPVLIIRMTESEVMGDGQADALRDEILAAYDSIQPVHLILDMQPVRYLSSAGIRPLLSLDRRVREHEGRLILCNLSPYVQNVLEATRLISTSKAVTGKFEHHADVAASVASLYQGPIAAAGIGNPTTSASS